MGKRKLLYRSFSLYQFFKYSFGRLMTLALLGFVIFLIIRDYTAMSLLMIVGLAIAGLIALALFLLIGQPELKIYSDKISYGPSAILPIRQRQKIFLINDMSVFEIKGSFRISEDVESDLYNMGRTDSFEPHRYDPYNLIQITFKDGTTDHVSTHIYIDKLNKAKEVVATLLSNQS